MIKDNPLITNGNVCATCGRNTKDLATVSNEGGRMVLCGYCKDSVNSYGLGRWKMLMADIRAKNKKKSKNQYRTIRTKQEDKEDGIIL